MNGRALAAMGRVAVALFTPFVLATAGMAEGTPSVARGTPAFVPTVAYVQEAEPILFTAVAGTDARWFDAIGTADGGDLSVASVQRLAGGARLAFRLAGVAPVTLDRLSLGDPTARFVDVAVGPVTIVPALPTSSAPLRRRALVQVGEGPVLRGWRFENVSDEVQAVSHLRFAPDGIAQGWIVVRVVDPDRATPFVDWHAGLLASLEPGIGRGRDADASDIEAALRDLLGAEVLRRPERIGLHLAPGELIDIVLLRSNLAVDLARTRVVLDPLLSGRGAAGGAWTVSLSSPILAGPWP